MIPLTKLVDRNGFGAWLTANGLTGLGVEVGTLHGDYARHLLDTWPGQLITIDPYDWIRDVHYKDGCVVDWSKKQTLDTEAVFLEAQSKLQDKRCEMWRKTSLESVHMFADGELDFVYLDGNHSFESVSAELPIWWRKVKRGGVLCGHDCYHRDDEAQQCGVSDAVLAFRDKYLLPLHITHCTSWWISKP